MSSTALSTNTCNRQYLILLADLVAWLLLSGNPDLVVCGLSKGQVLLVAFFDKLSCSHLDSVALRQ